MERLSTLDASNVITCRAGDRLLKNGGSSRSAFVVLEGTLAVSRVDNLPGNYSYATEGSGQESRVVATTSR